MRLNSRIALVAVLLMFCSGCGFLYGKGVSDKKLEKMTDTKLVKWCGKNGRGPDYSMDCYKVDGMARLGCESGKKAARENESKCSNHLSRRRLGIYKD